VAYRGLCRKKGASMAEVGVAQEHRTHMLTQASDQAHTQTHTAEHLCHIPDKRVLGQTDVTHALRSSPHAPHLRTRTCMSA